MTMHLFVFCYDIVEDGRRRAVASILEQVGMRVQDSVFEVRATEDTTHRLVDRIRSMLDLSDSLRVYPLPMRLLPRCITVGGAPISEAQDFLLL